ncbi:MAG: GNAT family N-acetyltransferase [Bacteroidota bacterium]|nr:GNAT family N-acetyltransferase [Bacteroidota bacterium]
MAEDHVSGSNNKLVLRSATKAEVPILLTLIKELAEYERLSDEVTATEDILSESLFGEHPAAEAIIAYYNDEPAAMAIYFLNFSTFVGRPGVYLEDLFVKPHLRGKGIGKALLKKLAKIAIDKKCGRFEWSVLDWNEPAIKFYKSLGAKPLEDWTIFRLRGKALEDLAKQ